jgi:ADP-ribose pyrophosphatase YjhB (NUDIX family)
MPAGSLRRVSVANSALTRIWRLARPVQWRLLWWTHATFLCGVTGVVRAGDGRVLLLKHRLWPAGRQWGFPGGYAKKGERHEDTVVREVREETGLSVTTGRLLEIRTGFRYRIEVYYEAVLDGGLGGLALDEREILEARLFDVSNLPPDMPPVHRRLAGPVAR